MPKLIVKKLLSMLAYAAVIWIIFFLGSGALLTTANFFADSVVRGAILLGFPVLLALLLIVLRRVQNMDLEGSYLAFCDGSKPTVGQELGYLGRFSHLRAEVVVFASLDLILVLALVASSSAPWYANLLAGVIFLILFPAVFLLLDALLWLAVHALWRRSAIKRAKKQMSSFSNERK